MCKYIFDLSFQILNITFNILNIAYLFKIRFVWFGLVSVVNSTSTAYGLFSANIWLVSKCLVTMITIYITIINLQLINTVILFDYWYYLLRLFININTIN